MISKIQLIVVVVDIICIINNNNVNEAADDFIQTSSPLASDWSMRCSAMTSLMSRVSIM